MHSYVFILVSGVFSLRARCIYMRCNVFVFVFYVCLCVSYVFYACSTNYKAFYVLQSLRQAFLFPAKKAVLDLLTCPT